jgi:hypothetical protein
MSEAEPMTMPSEVSMTRTLLVRKLSMARLTISLSTIVRLALASVRSKDLRLAFRTAVTGYETLSSSMVNGPGRNCCSLPEGHGFSRAVELSVAARL